MGLALKGLRNFGLYRFISYAYEKSAFRMICFRHISFGVAAVFFGFSFMTVILDRQFFYIHCMCFILFYFFSFIVHFVLHKVMF